MMKLQTEDSNNNNKCVSVMLSVKTKKKWKKVLHFDTRLTFLYIPIGCL
jgi:hypothetical protein